MAESAIEVKDVVKEYRMGELTVQILKGVDLKIRKGDFVVILGASGSGKSTLLNQIALLDTPTSGRILIGGEETSKMGERQRTELRLRKIGIVFQFFNLIPEFSVIENVMLPLRLAGIEEKAAKEKAKRLLALVGLEERLDNMPSQISGGQMQRVSIARALANDPEILFADEPTGNLDSKSAAQVIDLFKRINKEKRQTIVMITHNKDHAKEATQVVKIVDGRIVETEDFTLMFIEQKIEDLIQAMGDAIEKLQAAKSIEEAKAFLQTIVRAAREISYLDLREEEIMKEVETRMSSMIRQAKTTAGFMELLKKGEELESRIAGCCDGIVGICEELSRDAHVMSPERFRAVSVPKVRQIVAEMRKIKEINLKEDLVNQQVQKRLAESVGAKD